MKNIRLKMPVLVALVVLVVLVSDGLLALLSYQRASRSLSEQMELNYSVAADKYAQELTAWINTNATILDSVAAEITTGGIYDSEYEVFHRFLADNCRLLNKDGVIYDIYYTYPDNRMVCASDYLPDGSVDYSHDRDWFIGAAGTGELFFSAPYRDSDSGKPIITISKAVYRNNVLQGVLAADIFVDVLVDIIRNADVAADSYAFLVDQNLGMIAHPNEAYFFDGVPHGVMEIPGAPYAEVVSKIRSDSRDMVYLEDYDGVMRGVVVSRMENTGWYVGIATSRSVLMRGLGRLMRGFLIAAAAAVAAGGGILIFLVYALNKVRRQQRENEKQARQPEPPGSDGPEREKSSLAGPSPETSGKARKEEHAYRINLLVPILIIFLLMALMVLYTSRAIRSVAVANIREVGEDRISAAAAQLENYLEMEISSLWVTADTVDHMVHNGVSNHSILNYLMEETQNQKEHFDANITGLYGYVSGEYLDGLAWEPPENYDPTRRDWYLSAIEAQGEITIVSPYVDAQTDAVVISICRMLSNGVDVLSVDIMMDHIQEIVSTLQIKDKGYGFIVSRDGMLIAHQDETKKGRYLTEDEKQLALLDGILETREGIFEMTAGREKQTVFVHEIMNQWYVVIVINNRELFAEVRQQMTVNVLICAAIFALILFFYLLGRKNEQNYSRRIEEMRIEEQKQAYEAKALKLEKEAADRANQAKSDFLADVSHEIRTPINAVLGMNEMILRESTQAQHGEGAGPGAFGSITACARNIESAGNSLLAIVNDILDFSKIESGKMDLVEGEYRLSSVLSGVSNMISFRAREKGLEFIVDVDETLPDGLYGDEVRVRQIFTNLLTNAVKYTERGSIRMTLRGELRGAGSGQTVLLKAAVQDTGIGIRPEDLKKLFSKFQRLDLKQNSTVEGTGLGLAITHSLLEMMGGSIDVSSQYGKGSVFSVEIPQKITSAEPVGDFQARFQRDAREGKAYRELFRAPEAHILIVDDTKMNLTVAVGLLRTTLVQIDTASGGEEALRLTRANTYDIILMDQRMPKMDGVEVLRRVRGQTEGANRETPVICLTADAVIGARERYLAQGFTDYLTKPIDSRALERLLVRYLPEDKVLLVPEEEETAEVPLPAEAAEGGYAPLRTAGIDPAVGLGYCQNDEALYRSLLAEYAQSAGGKSRDMAAYFAAGSWKDYAILVHALKSSSRMIGAAALADVSARLEAAANAGREADVASEHAAMLALYRSVMEAIRKALGDADGGPAGPGVPESDDILEFLPE